MRVAVVAAAPRRLADPFVSRCALTTVPPAASSPTDAAPAPLRGVTFAAKDNLDVAGMPTGNGSPDWAATVGARDPTRP